MNFQLALSLVVLLIFGQFQVRARFHSWLQRIVDGSDLHCGAPYVATLEVEKANGIENCIGTLINLTHVITAAHCLDNGESVRVTLGNGASKEFGVSIRTKKWHIHPGFYISSKKYNDIAVIILQSPLDLNKCIQPVTLPDIHELKNLSNCITFDQNVKETSKELIPKQTSLLKNKCFEFVGKDQRLCEEFWATDSPNSCKEPMGSPLICLKNKNSQQVLVGFASAAGCYKGFTVYVNVAFHQKWLNLFSNELKEHQSIPSKISNILAQ